MLYRPEAYACKWRSALRYTMKLEQITKLVIPLTNSRHFASMLQTFANSFLSACDSARMKTLSTHVVFCMSQWSSGSPPGCGVRGPRFESHRVRLCLSRRPQRCSLCSLGHELHTLTPVYSSTQPYVDSKMTTIHALSNNNKWRW